MEQGSVLRRVDVGLVHSLISSLNPFGTGQCLTTDYLEAERNENLSQSLWNRAVSYDLNEKQRKNQYPVSIPLEQGSVLRL